MRLSATPAHAPAYPAILGVAEADQSVRCVACAHRCLIRPGRQGICRVRENRAGELVTLVYGQAVAANADPIEKKPLFHVYPGSVAFSIATRGCNFHCRHCQNWSIAQAERESLKAPTFALTPAAVVAAALRPGSRSGAYTYTEPTIFIEYVVETARLARQAGLANLLVTNGYQTPEALDVLAPLVEAANVDLKSFDDTFYRRVCGARLAPVLATLTGMRERGIWVEVTTLLIPGLNDNEGRLAALARWIVAELGPETPWHVTRFLPHLRLCYVEPTAVGTLERARKIGLAAGLEYVYLGNVPGHAAENTHCSRCGELLIRRYGLAVVGTVLSKGRCPHCGHAIPGRFDGHRTGGAE